MVKSRYNVPALEKGLNILEMLAHHKEPLGITDIYERNGMPKSSIFLILNTLEKLAYVKKTEDNKYSPTLKIYNIGMFTLSKLDIRQAARPYMEKIAEEKKFTVHLAILENDKALYIDKVNGPGFVQFSTQIGQSQLLHNSGVGKVLAAYLTEDQLLKAIEKNGLPQTTDNTMSNLETFKQFLSMVKANGYAIEDEEGEIGIRCIAAPIFDHKGKNVGALGITALRNELPSLSFSSVGEYMKDKALQISAQLGFSGKD